MTSTNGNENGPVKWVLVRALYQSPMPEVAEDLIADALTGLGAEGVVLDSPEELAKHDYEALAFDPESPLRAVSAYFPDNDAFSKTKDAIDHLLAQDSASVPYTYQLQISRELEQEWETAWKKHFTPILVTPNIVVMPTWLTDNPWQDKKVIRIDPEMAFGTGHHPLPPNCP